MRAWVLLYSAGKWSFYTSLWCPPEEGSIQVLLRSIKLSRVVVNLFLTVFAVMCSDKMLVIHLWELQTLCPRLSIFQELHNSGVYLHCIFKQEGIFTLTTSHTEMECLVYIKTGTLNCKLRPNTPTVSIIPHQCNEHGDLPLIFSIC